MLYWNTYKGHKSNINGIRKKYDNNIYTFDIETSSYLILNGKQIPACDYLKLDKKEQEECKKQACMYIWMFGINDVVYYGRTWKELKDFLKLVDNNTKELKYLYIHNASFEFQFLKSVLHFEKVSARKARKVMTAKLRDYNFLIRCSYMLSNCSLEYIPKVFNLTVNKKVGDLDYDKIRHSYTILTDKELGYCEYDCLVLYHYIKRELETYEDIKHIPTTSTGKVRKELKELTQTDFKYKRLVRKAINTDTHVYNMLLDAFFGGYTHANFIYTDTVINNVDSFDETSAYPYVLVSHKFPTTEFKKANIKKVEQMSKRCAYLLTVRFKNIKCKYYNNFISSSKCKNIKKGKYDNGRVIEAEELEITLTDVDFRFILDTYTCSYEIIESYWSIYGYLPKTFINFVLDKYVAKTKYKNVEGKELDYQKEKGKFNALYGMSVTNTIRDNVIYKDDLEEWYEEKLTNDEIIDKLEKEKKKAFLSFSYGVWVTAYARDNLLRRLIELDPYVLYADTDSLKLKKGYNKKIFEDYNKSVEERIKFVSKILKIPFDKFAPEDVFGKKHLLGVFEFEGNYQEFITQGAKKYAVKENDKIKITVAGVPKNGAVALKNLNEFRDNFVFNFEETGKNLLMYVENQQPFILTDYKNKESIVKDKSGCSLIPTTYVLGKALDYASLINDKSSKRAIYKE